MKDNSTQELSIKKIQQPNLPGLVFLELSDDNFLGSDKVTDALYYVTDQLKKRETKHCNLKKN
jgi:hypothetical protein